MYFTFAWRYFKAKKSTNAINVIAWVSVGAITVGTAALIIILSAFNGFESLVKSLYSSFYADIRIEPVSGKTLVITEHQFEAMYKIQGLKAVTRVAEEKALLQNGEFQTVVYLKGVDDDYGQVAGVPDKMVRGNFYLGNADSPRVVLGVGIENAIGVLTDRSILPLTLYMPKKGANDLSNPMDALGVGLVRTSGSFAIQQDFDNKFVLTNLDFARQYLNYGENEYSAVEVSVQATDQVPVVKQQLAELLGAKFKVLDRYEQNKTLYTTIRLEKWAIYGIFTLILLVAAFNMVGALTMLVLEKQKDIQVLQAMGASRQMIRKIFLTEGLVLAGIGATVGMLLAVLLYYLQINYKLVPLQGESFLIDYYPVKLVPGDFLLVAVTVMAIGLLASWFPANRAAKQAFELRN
ncbi:MAG TPA: FtsX-like permease family protein [Chitinophagaceae bacterium]|nr:FtsX-like permease family protein [Chitinophagaceae bacterium]